MKTKIKNSLMLFVIVVSGFLLICERENVASAVSEGLAVCGDVLIPSLFPFMVLSSFAMSTGVLSGNNKLISFIMNKIFKLPSASFSAVLFGFIGGYPVGAKVIAGLYQDGKINSDDAKHLFSFCVNAGPAFIVSAAGGMIMGSRSSGYVMLFSVCLSSLLTGIAYGRIGKQKRTIADFNNKDNKNVQIQPAESIINAVSSSCSGILSTCSWVLAFSAFSGIICTFISGDTAVLFFNSISEITSGLYSAAKLGNTPFAASCISFGGLCIMFQLLPYIKKCGIKISEYLLFRIINSIFTFFITKILLLFTDITVSVYSQMKPAIHYAPASAALMIMSAILMFDIARSKKSLKNLPYLS